MPLIGRSGLLGDHKDSIFSGVACGRGLMACSTYCITSSGLLCLFNSSRELEAWVDLKVGEEQDAPERCDERLETNQYVVVVDRRHRRAVWRSLRTSSSVVVLTASSEFSVHPTCSTSPLCTDLTGWESTSPRVFSTGTETADTLLRYKHLVSTLITNCVHLLSSLLTASPGAQYPDTLALTFDPAAKHLTCVYNDHSVYVWDVTDVRNAGKLYSALYHSSSVWSVEVSQDFNIQYYQKESLSCARSISLMPGC